MNLTQRYKVNEDIVYREEAAGAFLFDPETGNLKYMNACGKELFLMLRDQNDVSQAIERLTNRFPDTKRSQIENDVEMFLGQLEKNGFIAPLHP